MSSQRCSPRVALLGSAVLAASIFASHHAAEAEIVNGDFEQASLNGWTTGTASSSPNSEGECEVADSWIAGYDGRYGCLLTASANAFLPSETSAWGIARLSQTFSGTVGQEVALWVRPYILYYSYNGSIPAMMSIVGEVELFDAEQHNMIWQQSLDMGTIGVPSEWTRLTSDPLPSAGNYTLRISLEAATTLSAEASGFDSVNILGYLDVDEVQLVPEPSTLVLLVIGTASLLAYVWRRRSRA
jgi:hypothetical protein